MMEATPRFLRGIFTFEGKGYDQPQPLAPDLGYTVAADKRAQPVYLRAGNSSDELIVLAVLRDGETMRLFPIGARDSEHVPLAVVEDIDPGTRITLTVAAPVGTIGIVALDFGLVEI